MAATYYIAPSGSDSNSGATGAPWLTVAHANTVAVSGDTIKIRTGVYALDAQALKSGVVYMADTGNTPVFDGGGISLGAVLSYTNSNVIDGFEIRNYKQWGVLLQAASPAATGNNIVRNCHIHHCGGVDPAQDVHEWGIEFAYGTGNKAYNNHIHHIGQGGEAIGIWCVDASGVEAYGNEIHHCRKEGIRDFRGLNPWVHDNRVYACWNGLSPNSSVGGLWENNYGYDCTEGINPKEMNNDVEGALTLWGLTQGQNERTKVWHNTFFNCSYAGLVYGPNGPANDVDVKNNIFAGMGSQYVWDYSTARINFTEDYNLFAPAVLDWASVARPRLYHDMYDSNGGFQDTLANLYAATGFEQHGIQVNPQLNNPAVGDLDYPNTSPAYNAGTDLTAAREAHYGASRGRQMGARGLPAARKTWTDMTASVLSWSSNSFYNPYLPGVSDREADSYVITDTATNEWFVLDLGSSKSFDHVVMAQYAHFQVRNIKQWKWETGISPTGPWTQIAAGTHPDNEGSSFIYDLGATYTSRYLRFTAVSSWTESGATAIIVNEARVGLLSDAAAAVPTMADLRAQCDVAVAAQQQAGVELVKLKTMLAAL